MPMPTYLKKEVLSALEKKIGSVKLVKYPEILKEDKFKRQTYVKEELSYFRSRKKKGRDMLNILEYIAMRISQIE